VRFLAKYPYASQLQIKMKCDVPALNIGQTDIGVVGEFVWTPVKTALVGKQLNLVYQASLF